MLNSNRHCGRQRLKRLGVASFVSCSQFNGPRTRNCTLRHLIALAQGGRYCKSPTEFLTTLLKTETVRSAAALSFASTPSFLISAPTMFYALKGWRVRDLLGKPYFFYFCTSPSNLYSGLMSLTEVVLWRFRCRVCMFGLLVSIAHSQSSLFRLLPLVICSTVYSTPYFWLGRCQTQTLTQSRDSLLCFLTRGIRRAGSCSSIVARLLFLTFVSFILHIYYTIFSPLCQGNFLNFEDFFAAISWLSSGATGRLAITTKRTEGDPSSVRVLGCWSVGYECVYIYFFS